MAQMKIRGESQIMDLSILNAQLANNTIELAKLVDGAELIKRDGSVAMTADLDANSNKIVNLADGTLASDAINKGQLDSAIAGLTSGLEYKGSFDASAGSFPTDITTGDFYIVSVAGIVDGVELAIGDMIYANKTKAGATVAADWDKIDNTESDDILRDADVSTNADFTVDPTLLTDRATIKAFVDSAVNGATQEVYGESLTVTHNSPVVSDTANAPTAGTLRVFLNGLRMLEGAGNDYTLSGSTITFEYNLKLNDQVLVDYKY